MTSEKCEFEIKSVFKIQLYLVSHAILLVPIFFGMSVVIGMGATMLLNVFGVQPNAIIWTISSAIIYIILVGLSLYIYYFSIKRRGYKFYKDRVEYYDGFFIVELKTVYYNRITNISLSKGIFQKRYNVGNIYFETAGSGISEISLINIENPEVPYKWIKKKINIKNIPSH